MEVRSCPAAHQDARGEIIDILRNQPFDYATLINTNLGGVRGNHYHKETFQWVYILRGRMRVIAQMPDSAATEAVLEQGDLIVNVPHERHAFQALTDCEMLVLTKGPRGGENYELDTYRLEEPLIPKPSSAG